jgi:Ca2+-binding RTX toxin-like protein
MPKVSFQGNIPDQYASAPLYYTTSATFEISSLTDTLMIITFPDTFPEMRIVFSGVNLDGANEHADSIVKKVSFETESREVYTSFANAQYDFEHLYGTLSLYGVKRLYMDLLKKNDTVTGSDLSEGLHGGGGADTINGRGGADLIDGGRGKDRLTGGAGPDWFEFNAQGGRDVITDFEARGDGFAYDQLFVFEIIPDYEVHKIKGGIRVEIADSDASVTLLGVKKSDFDDGDFLVYH